MMFVDAGYLWAVMATVHGVGRLDDLVVSPESLAQLLRERVEHDGMQLLRIRWYDATDPTRRITNPRAASMAAVPGVRLVEGHLVRRGGVLQQKAVDTRLVADMVTIAHQHQVDRLVLLSGDEDMVPGVEAAEDLGLRVEVWSIEADDAAPTVSRELLMIADTHRSIDAADLTSCITSVAHRIATTPTQPPMEEVAAAPQDSAPEAAAAPVAPAGPVVVQGVPKPAPPRDPALLSTPVLEPLPPLWDIDQAAYSKPVELNHASERQRIHALGSTYADRWWQAAPEGARERVTSQAPSSPSDYEVVPRSIDRDLLRWAEDQGIDTWSATWTKAVLRDGWWYGIRTASKASTAQPDSSPDP